jgi:hypothetical protein
VIDPESAGEAVNISGCTFELVVKASEVDADSDAIFSLTSAANEILIITAASGIGQVHHDAAKTGLLAVNQVYHYTLRCLFSTGELLRVQGGNLKTVAL